MIFTENFKTIIHILLPFLIMKQVLNFLCTYQINLEYFFVKATFSLTQIVNHKSSTFSPNNKKIFFFTETRYLTPETYLYPIIIVLVSLQRVPFWLLIM